MKAHRRNRLITILAGTAGVAAAVALVLYALGAKVDHFYTPSEIVAGAAPLERTIRVGGLVVAGSLDREPGSLALRFDVTDNRDRITVEFEGILPDLFREGQGIIAEGQLLPGGKVRASKVLAKHDENYMPPEVAKSLEKYGHPANAGKKDKKDAQ